MLLLLLLLSQTLRQTPVVVNCRRNQGAIFVPSVGVIFVLGAIFVPIPMYSMLLLLLLSQTLRQTPVVATCRRNQGAIFVPSVGVIFVLGAIFVPMTDV